MSQRHVIASIISGTSTQLASHGIHPLYNVVTFADVFWLLRPLLSGLAGKGTTQSDETVKTPR